MNLLKIFCNRLKQILFAAENSRRQSKSLLFRTDREMFANALAMNNIKPDEDSGCFESCYATTENRNAITRRRIGGYSIVVQNGGNRIDLRDSKGYCAVLNNGKSDVPPEFRWQDFGLAKPKGV